MIRRMYIALPLGSTAPRLLPKLHSGLVRLLDTVCTHSVSGKRTIAIVTEMSSGDKIDGIVGTFKWRLTTYLAISSVFLLAFASGSQAVAQTQNAPWVQMESLSVNLGLGGQSGDGVLHLPNLGTNCTYPYSKSKVSAAASRLASQMSAHPDRSRT